MPRDTRGPGEPGPGERDTRFGGNLESANSGIRSIQLPDSSQNRLPSFNEGRGGRGNYQGDSMFTAPIGVVNEIPMNKYPGSSLFYDVDKPYRQEAGLREQPPQGITSINQNISNDLIRFILKNFNKNPMDKYDLEDMYDLEKDPYKNMDMYDEDDPYKNMDMYDGRMAGDTTSNMAGELIRNGIDIRGLNSDEIMQLYNQIQNPDADVDQFGIAGVDEDNAAVRQMIKKGFTMEEIMKEMEARV